MKIDNDMVPEMRKSLDSFVHQIPFNNLLGIEVKHLGLDHITLRMNHRDDLVGNFYYGILHGGVISSILDVAGGGMALIGAFQRTEGMPKEERMRVLTKIGTIDLRIDYLRPGKGEYFLATGTLLRTGKKVAVTRMELKNNENTLIAVGTGTYLCG